MGITASEIRPGAYYDSVVLMQLQRALSQLPGILDAGVVMGTPANLELLQDSDLLTEEAAAAGAEDLIITVEAEDSAAANEALAQVDSLLKQRRSRTAQAFHPRSLQSASKQLPEAEWVLISVPGRYAAGVAREALDAGRHVFLYSDNVSLQDEVSLKQQALEKGLLLMGPDCGTAIINGVGLGFANRVRRGNVGLVGASGTGLQAITAYIHEAGGGVSQAIGTGGRDLSSDVGGVTALQALDVLGRDPQTDVVVLVSKPPSARVATKLLAAARRLTKPVVVYFMGQPLAQRQSGNLCYAFNLHDAAQLAVSVARQTESSSNGKSSHQESAEAQGRFLRALFSGGTLAYELLLGLQNVVAPLYSNVPLSDEQRLENPLQSKAHTVLDLGEDEFTQGRLHPMMDNDLRIRRLRQEASDAESGLILLDLVLGEGAHPDPASELAPVISEVTAQHQTPVAVLVVGTGEDPQEKAQQIAQLQEAGAQVFESMDKLLQMVAATLAMDSPEISRKVSLDAFGKPLAAINVGLESFYESVQGQGAEAVHVDWRPPAGGNEKMMALLARMKGQ
jgi:FdrA protein